MVVLSVITFRRDKTLPVTSVLSEIHEIRLKKGRIIDLRRYRNIINGPQTRRMVGMNNGRETAADYGF